MIHIFMYNRPLKFNIAKYFHWDFELDGDISYTTHLIIYNNKVYDAFVSIQKSAIRKEDLIIDLRNVCN